MPRHRLLSILSILFLTFSTGSIVLATNSGPQLLSSFAKATKQLRDYGSARIRHAGKVAQENESQRQASANIDPATGKPKGSGAEEGAGAVLELTPEEQQAKVFAELREKQELNRVVSTDSYYKQAVNGNGVALDILKSIDINKYNQAQDEIKKQAETNLQNKVYSDLRNQQLSTAASEEAYYNEAVAGNQTALEVLRTTYPDKYTQALTDIQNKTYSELRQSNLSTSASTQALYNEAVNGSDEALNIIKTTSPDKYNQAIQDRQNRVYAQLREHQQSTTITTADSYYQQAVNGNDTALSVLKLVDPTKYDQALQARATSSQIFSPETSLPGPIQTLVNKYGDSLSLSQDPTTAAALASKLTDCYGRSGKSVCDAAFVEASKTGEPGVVFYKLDNPSADTQALLDQLNSEKGRLALAAASAYGGYLASPAISGALIGAEEAGVPLGTYLYVHAQAAISAYPAIPLTLEALKVISDLNNVSQCALGHECNALALFAAPVGPGSGLPGAARAARSIANFAADSEMIVEYSLTPYSIYAGYKHLTDLPHSLTGIASSTTEVAGKTVEAALSGSQLAVAALQPTMQTLAQNPTAQSLTRLSQANQNTASAYFSIPSSDQLTFTLGTTPLGTMTGNQLAVQFDQPPISSTISTISTSSKTTASTNTLNPPELYNKSIIKQYQQTTGEPISNYLVTPDISNATTQSDVSNIIDSYIDQSVVYQTSGITPKYTNQ